MVGAAGLEPATLSLEGIIRRRINDLAGLRLIAQYRYKLPVYNDFWTPEVSALTNWRNPATHRVGTKSGTREVG